MQELEQIAAERESAASSAAGSADLQQNNKRSSWPMPLSPETACYSVLSPTSPSSNHSTVSGTVRRPSQSSHVGQARSMSTPMTKCAWTDFFPDSGNLYSMERAYTPTTATTQPGNHILAGLEASCQSAPTADTDWPALGRSQAHQHNSGDTSAHSKSSPVEDPCLWTSSAFQNHLLETAQNIAGAAQQLPISERPRFPAKTALVSDRLQSLKQCAEELGFGSLDAALSAYYTADLSDCPALHNERSLGRNRRLPTLFSEIQASSNSWNMWEQTGFKQEILKAAEHFYVEECGQVGDVASILGDNAQTEVTMENLAKAHQRLQNTVCEQTFRSVALRTKGRRQRGSILMARKIDELRERTAS